MPPPNISNDATSTPSTVQKPTGEPTNPLLMENGSTLTQDEAQKNTLSSNAAINADALAHPITQRLGTMAL